MADSLVWLLVKDNNSFLHKRGRTARSGAVQFSNEPGNLLNVNSFKYSGLANSKAVDVSSKKRITLSLKAPKKAVKPAKAVAAVPLKLNAKKSVRVIKSQACNKFYRADLASAAAARYKKLYTAARVSKNIVKGLRTKMGRNSR